MPILGVIASSTRQGQSADAGDMFAINAVSVGSAGVSSITFSSIPSTYTHLQIRYNARTSRTATSEDVNLQVNSDTGNNYSWHLLYGDGSSPVVSAASTTFRMLAPGVAGANATSGIFGVGVIDILDYANTNKFKTIRALGGNDRNGAGEIMYESGNWRNTNAITSLTLTPAAGTNFVQYSSFVLYGIKGA